MRVILSDVVNVVSTVFAVRGLRKEHYMPGYYIHFAACTPKARENLSFLRGIEAPDILKKHFRMYGISGACEKYNSLKTPDMPDYKILEERIKQKEKIGSTDGLHYGVSSQPDVLTFWQSLSNQEKANPFYKGYLWHLITDEMVYALLDIDKKFEQVMRQTPKDVDIDELRKAETKKLHSDWDRLNACVRDRYPDVILSSEVLELGVVNFIEDKQFSYVDPFAVYKGIDYLRSFNPLEADENIIKVILEHNI